MKILFFINVVPPDYGGGFLRVFRTAARFKGYGHLFKILTYTPSKSFKPLCGIKKKDIVHFPIPLTSQFILPYYLFVHKKEFDALYVASVRWFTVLPVFVCHLLKKNVAIGVTLSGVDSPSNRGGFFRRPFLFYKNLQFRWADYILVNSKLLYDECYEAGVEPSKIRLVNNPVDTTKFYPVDEEQKEIYKHKLNINTAKTVFLFVGTIGYRKGVNLFPDIFQKYFIKGGESCCFIICGNRDGGDSDVLLNEIRQVLIQYDSELIVREEISNVDDYYKIADVFLFPTTNEGMPNVILEAMASGCKIVCNTLPGITDTILDNTFLVRDNNKDDFSNKMLSFCYHNQKVQEVVNKNLCTIKELFSPEIVDHYLQDILSKKTMLKNDKMPKMQVSDIDESTN